ncbi:MAG: glucose-6-phosphate isomerase [Mycoplasma sp.]|nr:glucose-6-phosphate isomerase [Mycoplasma sp.]
MVKLDYSNFQNKEKAAKLLKSYEEKIKTLNESLKNKKCKGHEMLGWMDYPFKYDEYEINEIIKTVDSWRTSSIKKVVMLGIGGSYIGVRAGIDFALPEFSRDMEIIYVSSLSSSYIASLLEKLKKEDFYLIVISKSGTTLEISVAFRLFYNLLFEKFGSEGAKERVVCVTDSSKGILKNIAKTHDLKTFSIPDNVGGRFSAITPIGLFPMAVMGLNPKEVLQGCKDALKDTSNPNLDKNTAYQYACLRNWQYTKNNKQMEILCVYENSLFYLTEHWKQLFAESEGKDGKGLYPSNCLFTTDLHSVGQFLQDGKKFFFETCLSVKTPLLDKKIEPFLNNEDGLDYLNNKTLDYVNKVAASSTIDAHHIEGGVDIIKLELQKRDAYNFGYIYSWFSKALAMSALLIKVNPFNQPGVEEYKKRTIANLKK